MSELLYKVSEPRDDWTFAPRPFWRAADWSFSDDHEHEGLLEDCVLFAAEFDEINLHLLPKVWRLRVWLNDEERCRRLNRLGFSWANGSRALIFVQERNRHLMESFCPTVYVFDRAGFEQTPTNEFVSREPRTAVSAETIAFDEALRRWHFDLAYIEDPDAFVEALRSAGIDHQVQT